MMSEGTVLTFHKSFTQAEIRLLQQCNKKGVLHFTQRKDQDLIGEDPTRKVPSCGALLLPQNSTSSSWRP